MTSARPTTYREASGRAIADALRSDPAVILLTPSPPPNLEAEFGTQRVIRVPVSEAAVAGVALGAAIEGLRPIVEWTSTTFSFPAFDQIVNQMAKTSYMSGGHLRAPVVIRAWYFTGARMAAQHTATAYAYYAHTPGLKLAVPSTPGDVYGLLRSAVDDPGPVLIFEADSLGATAEVVPPDHRVPLGRGAIRRVGTDVTVVAIGAMVPDALEAASRAGADGISAEVIDPRTLAPLDLSVIETSVSKTGRLVVVDDSPPFCSVASEMIATVAADGSLFSGLTAPPVRVCALPVPVPFSPALEDASRVSVTSIERAIGSVTAVTQLPGGLQGSTRHH